MSHFLISCKKEEDSTTSPTGPSTPNSSTLGFTGSSIESLPQITSESQSGTAFSLVGPPLYVVSGNISSYNSLSSFFEQECFMPDGDDFCPAGTDTSGGDSNPRKFTIMTLLGLIYHAEMYSGYTHTSCEGTAGSVNASSFVSATSSGSDADRFIIDYNTLLGCVKQDTTGSGGTVYQAYSINSTDYQATLTSRYRVPYAGSATPGQTDVFQVYVSLSGETPTFLAFNFSGANTMYSRAILLVNLTTHKFAAKYFSAGVTNQAVTAIGVGGINRSTGVPNTGYYFTRFLDNTGSPESACVSNSDGSIQADNTNCLGNSVPINWSSSDDVKLYLGMTAADATNLTGFLTRFSSDALLVISDSPEDATDDPELFFPKTIIAQ